MVNTWDANKDLLFVKLEDICVRLRDVQEHVSNHSAEISKIESIEVLVRDIQIQQIKDGKDLAKLSVKSTVWGAAGGLFAGALLVAVKLLG